MIYKREATMASNHTMRAKCEKNIEYRPPFLHVHVHVHITVYS